MNLTLHLSSLVRVKTEPVSRTPLVDDEAQEAQSGDDTEGSLKDFIVPDSDAEVATMRSVSSFIYLLYNSQTCSRKTATRRELVPVQACSSEDSDGLSEYERCIFLKYKKSRVWSNLSCVWIGSNGRKWPK